ncbi:uncharacterized protein LACBIDRAFT_305314 [Laccaria bicolor S238N-H82]|uniref:Predicted protein n=1 Tax=Laccaria bicolor (strain S238N-H82 / ATCC MYA-4686) TaxID=486041 RepID=B0CTX7_LACBS|nr:uncharacterized protein LACBIDRAFT_305314 [Laccaria bicolor S238N-H82]EDR13991.1 predicted protein [Laccaria bicolor S238N-H82]|eukprot:XP_001874550.1 predicted protein [Laccaria bicolor S238N-H82]
MDQDSFRRLLETPGGASSSLSSRSSLLAQAAGTKPKTIDASKPAFKPRKVKKQSDAKYRDRAAERRGGEGNDYAQIEAVLEDFEKRAADAEDKDEVEAQRQYLGGDGDHTILVKGLDFALLEQNKARSLNSAEDDETLEEAFLAASSGAPSTVPKKRTREDIIRELKEKRGSKPTEDASSSKPAEEESRLLEEAKQKGKFKPIGFKPIGDGDPKKKKKKKVETEGKDGERKKKKRKVEDGSKAVNGTGVDATEKGSMLPPPVPSKALETLPPAVPEPEPLEEDFNIFADVGEYEGIGLESDDDDDDDNPKKSNDVDTPQEAEVPNMHRRWIGTDEPEPTPSTNPPESLQQNPTEPPTSHSLPPEGEEEEQQPTRLVPLASSALPSIKEFLAMEKAAGSYGKKKKGKDKKKSGGTDEDGGSDKSKKLNAEAKAERDYKRLKSYTDKKAGDSAAK